MNRRRFVTLSLPGLCLAAAGAKGLATTPDQDFVRQWMLLTINGEAIQPGVTLDLTDPARLSGQGPCNRWFARQTAELPALAVVAIGATRRACAELALEQRFLLVLSDMTLARISQTGTLVLTGPEDQSLEFSPLAE